jgi:hypothetical protein
MTAIYKELDVHLRYSSFMGLQAESIKGANKASGNVDTELERM